MSYLPTITAEEFVQRLTELGPYEPVKRPNALPIPWEDVLVKLVSTYDLDGVTLANFRFRTGGLPQKGWECDWQFSEGYTTTYYVVENTHEVSQFYYKECHPSSLGLQTDRFLEYLLLEWEYWRAIKTGGSPKKSDFLTRGLKIADHHLIRRAFGE